MANDEFLDLQQAQRELHDAINQLKAKRRARPKLSVAAQPEPYCTFCGKGRHETRAMVSGEGVHICAECVEQARTLVGMDIVLPPL
jgi:hypothetical protein